MSHPSLAECLDVSFSVPFVHRVRFTQDVLREEQDVLLGVLEPSGPTPPRVQFWVDGQVAHAQPELLQQLDQFATNNASRFRLAADVQVVPGGEAIKNDIHLLEGMLRIFEAGGMDRRSYVVVLGGGAVLDAVGFAAAIAHRGLRLVRLPTTTLSQADSGVGVKNSVNLFGKKNWVGSFGVPWAVINDLALLRTLPDRDFRCGFSEAVKVALLKDADFFTQICANAERIRTRDLTATAPIIRDSAQWHLRHITRGGDPFENEMARPLDFGHWSAHKLEILSDFALRHGEAVALGVAVDCLYSARVHGFPRADAQRVLQCLKELGFTLYHPTLHDSASLFAGLEEFRQHLGGELTITLLQGVGRPIDVHEIDRTEMQSALDELIRLADTKDSLTQTSSNLDYEPLPCSPHCR